MQKFFRESNLVALRELALRQIAHEFEYRMVNDERGSPADEIIQPEKRNHHRILVHVTADPQTAMLLRRAKRVGDFLEADCLAVTVQPLGDLSALPEDEREAINRHLTFARNLHIDVRILEGEDPASALVDFARQNQITQIFLARPQDGRWFPLLSPNVVQRIVALAKDIQIVIVSERDPVER